VEQDDGQRRERGEQENRLPSHSPAPPRPHSRTPALPHSPAPAAGAAVIRTREQHNVSRGNIDPDALKVLYHLSRQGYTAYLVGGGVRDLLLGRKPKDFDVGTDAHPQTIRRLFRNCFLIGRRFRLAHIKFGTKVIETSTFRRQPEAAAEGEQASLLNHRDNTFGSPEEDARRRDFTINGLFYDIRTFSVIDHVGGLEDLERRVVRSIGDPSIRFREDPVRMIRAVRFAARLGFQIEPGTWAAIGRHHGEILKAAPPRLLEEITRLFAYGAGEAAVRLLWRSGLLGDLFSEIDAHIGATGGERSGYWTYLSGLDRVGGERRDAPPAALIFSVLVFPLIRDQAQRAAAAGQSFNALEATLAWLRPTALRYRMPKRVFSEVLHIVESQRRFEVPQRRFHQSRLAAQEWFPAALALRRIHLAATGGDTAGLDEWERLGATHPARDRHPPAGQGAGEPPGGRRRRRPRRRGGRRRRESAAARGDRNQERNAAPDNEGGMASRWWRRLTGAERGGLRRGLSTINH